MQTRLFVPVLVLAVLAGCAPTAVESDPQLSPAASDVAAASTAPSEAPSPTPEATPTPTPSPTPSPTPTPEPWQKFSSKKNRYSIKYPPDWVATPATPGFADRLDDEAATAVFIDRDVVDSGYTVDLPRSAKSEIAYNKSHFDAKLLSDRKVKVGAWNGRLIKMTGYDDGLETYFQLLILAKGRVAYYLDWRSVDDGRDEDKALFERMYKSFKPKS